MIERLPTLDPSYFAEIYAKDIDPWRFASSQYERFKYSATIAALTKSRYARGFELGCSIGVLTRELGKRCDELLAVDVAEAPLIEAKRRCADLRHVRFESIFAPRQWPEGRFDLIVLSEVVYYLSADDVKYLAERARSSLVYGGDIVLVHWLGATNYPLTGDEAANLFIAHIGQGFHIARADRHDGFRLDVLSRNQADFAELGQRPAR
jgi:SAM-dependent methyltransferase